MAAVTGWDCTAANILDAPHTGQPMGYTTGGASIAWTAADWAAHPGAVRICQDSGTDTTADELDVESGAATPAQAAVWYAAAEAAYAAGTRPGQRQPAVYVNQSNAAATVAAIGGEPRIHLADYEISEGQAAGMLGKTYAGGLVVGVQYADAGLYDLDVWDSVWLGSAHMQIPGVPGTWTSILAYAADNYIVGYGTDFRLYSASYSNGKWDSPVAIGN